MELAGLAHGAEIRRCLITMDVEGFVKVRKHVAPHFPDLPPHRALIAVHMARVEMKKISLRLKSYSLRWLEDEANIRRIKGKWVEGAPREAVVAESVGIAVRSKYPGVAKRIHRAMDDALQNSRAKGITEAPIQRENMLKARDKERFKLRIA